MTSSNLSERAKTTSPQEEDTLLTTFKGARPKDRREFHNRVRSGSGRRGSKSRSPSKATKEKKDRENKKTCETTEERRERNLRVQLQRSLSFTSNEAHVATSPSELPLTLPHLSNPTTSPIRVDITFTDITQSDSLEVSSISNLSLQCSIPDIYIYMYL